MCSLKIFLEGGEGHIFSITRYADHKAFAYMLMNYCFNVFYISCNKSM